MKPCLLMTTSMYYDLFNI